MDHVIKGKNTSSLLKITLHQNEYVIADPENLIAAHGDVHIMPFQKPGFLRNLADKLKGNNLPLHIIRAETDLVWFLLATPAQSSLTTIHLFQGKTRQSDLVIRQDKLLAAQQDLTPDGSLPRDIRQLGEWLDSDLLTLTGAGCVFIHGFGTIEQIMLQPDQELHLDAAHLIAWDQSVICHPVKSSAFLSIGNTPQWGEHKNLLRVSGSGSIWLQTRTK